MTALISFSGYATAGKDAAADSLVQLLGFVKTYMSKPLEQALLTLDPWVPSEHSSIDHSDWMRYSELHALVGYDESKKNPEVRRLLQSLGTEIGRNMFGEDTWLDLAFKEIAELREDGLSVCLTGVRYFNELTRVREADGISVWVDRPGVEAVNTHSSEHTLSAADCDFVVVNGGDLGELAQKMERMFKYAAGSGAVVTPNNDCVFGAPKFLGHGTYNWFCETHNFNLMLPHGSIPTYCGSLTTWLANPDLTKGC